MARPGDLPPTSSYTPFTALFFSLVPTPIPLLSRGTIRMQRKEKVDQGSPDSGGKLTANLLCDLQEVTRPL